MAAPSGVYARRNAGHKTARAAALDAAVTDTAQLAAAYDWFRSSVKLLARRRPPSGISQDVHRAAAARVRADATAYLTSLARRIDRGELDAQKG